MIVFPGGDVKNNFNERIETLHALLIKIFPGFKSHFINSLCKPGFFIKQVRNPAIDVGSADANFFPFFIMLLV